MMAATRHSWYGSTTGAQTPTGTEVMRLDGYGRLAVGTNSISSGNSHINVVGADGYAVAFFASNYSGGLVMSMNQAGQIALGGTTVGSGTNAAQTINYPSGRIEIGPGSNTVTVANGLVSTTSKIIATINTHDTTATSVQAVPTASTITFWLNLPATAETVIS